MTPDDPAARGPDQADGAVALLHETIDAACAALAEAAEVGRDLGSRRAQLQTAEWHLNQAARLVEHGRRELSTAATEIVRVSLPEDACGIPWPVCRRCLGTGLTSSGGSSWCRSCGRPGGAAAARATYLCPDRATVTVKGDDGDHARMCLCTPRVPPATWTVSPSSTRQTRSCRQCSVTATARSGSTRPGGSISSGSAVAPDEP